jgi:serralysin
LSFLPYAGYQGGVTVAVGDVNGDGFGDIVTGAAGVGGNGHVKVFALGAQVQSFFAFGGSWTGGIFVAAGDVNGDGFADLIVGKGLGGDGQVTVYSGVNNAVVLANFFAYPPLPVVSLVPVFGDPVTASSSVEVRVGACDTNGDGHADILTGPGPGLSPLVKVFDGLTLAELDSFFAFDPAFQGGIFVGG